MIDMGAVLGGRATVGKNCHVGAGAVLAGVIEPASATPGSAEPNSKYQVDVITGYLTDLGYETVEYTFADSNDVASVAQSACDGCDVI